MYIYICIYVYIYIFICVYVFIYAHIIIPIYPHISAYTGFFPPQFGPIPIVQSHTVPYRTQQGDSPSKRGRRKRETGCGRNWT